jgi:hypothetical protein
MSDMTNANGQIQQASESAPAQEQAPQQLPLTREASSIPVTALRLLLGLALEGRDAAATRLNQWEASVRTSSEGQARTETGDDLAPHASIGMLMETQTHMRELLRSMSGVSEEVRGRAGGFATFMFSQWPFAVAKPRVDRLRLEFEDVLEQWAALGRREEQLGRQVARQAMASMVDEVFDAMAKNPEVRELIEQQSIGMAETAVEGVRERTASADALVERLVHNVLRRPSDIHTAAPSNIPPASPTSQQNG